MPVSGVGSKSTVIKIARSRQPSQSVTLESVAKLAGVAPTTVSRALNHPEKVAVKTLERVREAITHTGYVPNLLAGGLASNRSLLIAAIIPNITNPVYAETIQSFTQRIKAKGYQVLLGEAGYDLETEAELVSAVLSRRPDAIFLTGIHHSQTCRRQLLAAEIPIVETWDVTPTPLDIVVGFSHDDVGQAVARFLFDKGYQAFGVASAGDPRALMRNKAFVDELAHLGAKNVVSSIHGEVASLEIGRKALSELIDAGHGNMAVFCSSDTMAQGVITEALARGLNIPEELAIVGFGDQAFAAHTYPALTSVKIDHAAIGKRSADALLAHLNHEPLVDAVVNLGFQIIVRDTA